jgi:hypothetical protein
MMVDHFWGILMRAMEYLVVEVGASVYWTLLLFGGKLALAFWMSSKAGKVEMEMSALSTAGWWIHGE